MNKQTKTVPTFVNEAQERAFWETHDSTEYLDWSKARKVTLPNLKPTTKTISLRLPQHTCWTPSKPPQTPATYPTSR
nr:BrnA antitoxin family protein [Polaromonas sp. UBA4122]